MNVLRTSWRRSLAAAALWAMLGPASGDAVADDPPIEPAKPAQLKGDRPDDAARRDRDKKEKRARAEAHQRELREMKTRARHDADKPARDPMHEHRKLEDRARDGMSVSRGDRGETKRRQKRAQELSLHGGRVSSNRIKRATSSSRVYFTPNGEIWKTVVLRRHDVEARLEIIQHGEKSQQLQPTPVDVDLAAEDLALK